MTRRLARRVAIDRRAFVAMIALGPLACAAEAGQPNDPLAAMTAVYRRAVKGESSNWISGAGRDRDLSKGLAALWAKADARTPQGDDGPVDFDVVADTNGLTLTGFTLKVEKRTDTTATLAATLRYRERNPRPQPSVVRYDLVLEGGVWKIDDIRGFDWSVRAMLGESLKSD